MIPLVMVPEELRRLRVLVAHAMIERSAAPRIPYTIGTMIELPRACVVADRIAEHADFFSFGTNDLTQTTFGLSRDDAGRFLPAYIDRGRACASTRSRCSTRMASVRSIELGVRGGRATKPGLKVGICGEHGGEPSSVEFCHAAGFDYVSCSPFRVPIAQGGGGPSGPARGRQAVIVGHRGQPFRAATGRSDAAMRTARPR